MFQHLDDPAPPDLGASLPAVLERAEGMRQAAARRHRAWRRAGRTAAVVAGTAAAASAGLVLASQPARAPSSETAYQFDAKTAPLAVGTAVPAAALTDVVFVSGTDGYAVAEHRNRLLLAATVDGGVVWRVADPGLPSPFTGADAGSATVEFTSTTDGFLWSTSGPASTAGLWMTADGGASWLRAPIGPYVYDESAIGSDVWALTGTCPPDGGQTTPPDLAGASCGVGLDLSTDGGRHWEPSGATPPAVGLTGGRAFGVELARVTSERAYVLSSTPQLGAELSFTADGGASWSVRPLPCAAPFDLGAELALSGTDDLWLVCGGQATAGSQAKALYRSSDGGQAWVLAAQTGAFAGTPSPPPGAGSLPLTGYVAPYSVGHKNLAVLSPHEAWLWGDRGRVVETTDGGATWTPVGSLAAAGFSTGAPGNLTFLSPRLGWVVEQGVGLWATSDGLHWAPAGT